MKCSNCDHLVSDRERFCPNCGQKIESKSDSNQNTKYCSNCGESMEKDSQYCPNCGYSTDGENNHNINSNNQSSKFLSGQYDRMIVIGYGMLFLQFWFGIVFGIVSAIIGFYLITRPNNTNGTDLNDLINNPSRNTFIHGILLIILPFCVFCLLFVLYYTGILVSPW